MTIPCPTCHGSAVVIRRRQASSYAQSPIEYEEDCPNPDCENGQIEVCDCGEVLRFCQCEVVELKEEIAA